MTQFIAVSPCGVQQNGDREIDSRRHCAPTDSLGWLPFVSHSNSSEVTVLVVCRSGSAHVAEERGPAGEFLLCYPVNET